MSKTAKSQVFEKKQTQILLTNQQETQYSFFRTNTTHIRDINKNKN